MNRSMLHNGGSRFCPFSLACVYSLFRLLEGISSIIIYQNLPFLWVPIICVLKYGIHRGPYQKQQVMAG